MFMEDIKLYAKNKNKKRIADSNIRSDIIQSG